METWLIEGIVTGVIANGLTTIVASIGNKSRKSVQELFSKNPIIKDILKKATVSIANATELEDEQKAEKVRLFLSSQDVEVIVRQIYSSKLTSDKIDYLKSIRTEFDVYLSLFLNEPQQNLKGLAEQLFNSLLESCECVLSISIDNGLLSAHEAKSSFRYRMIIDELGSIKRNLEFLTTAHKIDVHEIFEFEKKYLQQIVGRHGYITPPFFDTARKFPIDKIFVSPKIGDKYDTVWTEIFSIIYRTVLLGNPGAGKSTISYKLCHDLAINHTYLFSWEETSGNDIVRLINFLKKKYSIDWIKTAEIKKIDDGKTIRASVEKNYLLLSLNNEKTKINLKIDDGRTDEFIAKMENDKLNIYINYSDRLFLGRQFIPILVILRDYGAEKKAHSCSILQFIETTANSKYQINPPPNTFEHLLLNGSAIVIFDGLDELLDTGYRQEISNDIESFCNLYPSIPVLVTSREVGYEQTPLDVRQFKIFHLLPFDDYQVRNYVNKWFAADTDLMLEQQKQKANAFLEESKIVPDLRSNALMLALMCNIYRGENYIPKNRPDLYEKCTVMLFEKWDKSRGVHIFLPFEAHIRPAMMYLAHWIYANEFLQGGVTEQKLIAKAVEYLNSRRFEDRDEAEKAAREFIDFCKGRAWVFTDIGVTYDGERLYQFTHRTFLEYFTSGYLVRTNSTPEALIAILMPRIANREWDVVAQLAFQLQNKNIEGAGDELLSILIKHAIITEDTTKLNLFSFAVRCLEFMVPSPIITRYVTTAYIEYCTSWGIQIKQKMNLSDNSKIKMFSDENKPIYLLEKLLCVAGENRTTIESSIEKLLSDRINHGSELEAILTMEIIAYLYSLTFPSLYDKRKLPCKVSDFWRKFPDRIFHLCSNRFEVLSRKYFEPCYESFKHGKVTIENLVDWHGIESLFDRCESIIYAHKSFTVAELLINSMMFATSQTRNPHGILIDLNQCLQEVGNILLSSPPPWIIRLYKRPFGHSGEIFISPLMIFENNLRQDSHKSVDALLNLDANALFGSFALFAAMLEAYENNDIGIIGLHELVKEIESSPIPFFDSIRWNFLARYAPFETDIVQAEMVKCGFNPEQQAFIWRWIRKELNFISDEIKYV